MESRVELYGYRKDLERVCSVAVESKIGSRDAPSPPDSHAELRVDPHWRH